MVVDYVSKWVEAMACPNNDSSTVIKFLKRQIFSWFGMPRVVISDGGSHFCNFQLAKVLKHYGVRHKVAKPYHPKTNGQAEACHLLMEMEYRALWALKFLNYDPSGTAENRRRQIIELEEMRLHAYDSSKNYKEKLKSKWSGPFMFKNVLPHGAVELTDPSSKDPQRTWMVNGQRLKHYLGGEVKCLSTIMELVDLN
ncbi:uncharacterized protein LOC128196689 [Vigna angularis]|uniref:uncharacterized protein LOC128196689 n=1 Tax=Phaseolus angularis TaxID=3914 RepID=UPI0022B3E871|nr:uncharacterized protein LOC128196689 [Vigna angularis]